MPPSDPLHRAHLTTPVHALTERHHTKRVSPRDDTHVQWPSKHALVPSPVCARLSPADIPLHSPQPCRWRAGSSRRARSTASIRMGAFWPSSTRTVSWFGVCPFSKHATSTHTHAHTSSSSSSHHHHHLQAHIQSHCAPRSVSRMSADLLLCVCFEVGRVLGASMLDGPSTSQDLSRKKRYSVLALGSHALHPSVLPSLPWCLVVSYQRQ